MDRIDGRTVAGAVVELNGAVVAHTDENGGFSIDDANVSWGPNTISVVSLSTEEVRETDTFWITGPREALEFSVILNPPIVDLDPLIVGAAREPSIRPRFEGFERRRTSGWGRFLTQDDIVASDIPNLSRALLRLGLTEAMREDGSVSLYFRRLADGVDKCSAPLTFLNGMLLAGLETVEEWDRLVALGGVYGIETYGSLASMPAEFNRTGSACGVIAVWTH